MRPDQLARATISGGQSIPVKVSKGHLNGLLLFQSVFDPNATITVRRRARKTTYVLASGLLVGDCARISEIDGGYGFGASKFVSKLEDVLVAKATITAAERGTLIEATTGQRALSVTFIDLGSLFLDSDNELDVTISAPAGAAAISYGLYAVSAIKRPDFMKQYDVVLDFDTTHHNVEAIYYRTAGSKDLFDYNEVAATFVESAVQFQIRDDDDVAMLDGVGALCASLISSSDGGLGDQQVIRIYKRRDIIPADVYVKASGVVAAPASIYMIVVRNLYDLASTSENTISEADSLSLRLADLEKRDEATATALRHAGQTVKSAVLAGRTEAVR